MNFSVTQQLFDVLLLVQLREVDAVFRSPLRI